jgi:hypothetical protein
MSVLARLRGKSQMDVFQLAEEIRAEATRLVWNTNVVPKGWRDIFSKPMCLLCQKLYNQIRAANSIWANTEEKVQERKDATQKAINTLQEIYDLINYMATTLPVDWNKFDTLLNLMLKESDKLKNWKDGVKLKKK